MRDSALRPSSSAGIRSKPQGGREVARSIAWVADEGARRGVAALVIDGDQPRSASVDSERWLIQARVEGTYRFDGGATLIPLADSWAGAG